MSAKILIVDDDPLILDVLVRLLKREGYETITARDGLEALQTVANTLPDLILLDVQLPKLDGFSVCQCLKNDERTALIPVTMLTGMEEREHRRRGMEVGADDFLTKPLEHSLLQARIRSQLRLKRLTDQLERTESVIFMLALTVETKDAYTEGHLWRLASYGEQLAIAAGLSLEQSRAVRYGGILHDIGKIGVDDAILRKPGSLTPEEYAQIKQHPEFGARIVAPMRFAREVQPIILAHHEQWNGRGYPYGLRGEEIPVGARIIAIVDAYDAMTTDRPYRQAVSKAEALQRLCQGAGKQWDSELIAVFLDLIEQDLLRSPSKVLEHNLEQYMHVLF